VRLFVAAYPPPAVLADFVTCVSGLAVGAPREPGQSVRLVPPERIHLTLNFLGDVPDEREPAADEALAAAVRHWTRSGGSNDRVGRRHGEPRSAPQLRIGGGGRFGRGTFTTLWAGIRGDTAQLGDLVTEVRRELRAARLPFDAKPFRPHVTIARPGDRLPADDLAADLAVLGKYEGPTWTVDKIALVESQPGPNITYVKRSELSI
jgi:RNA 2',3'-cyclic 3'-phosphodiesterase